MKSEREKVAAVDDVPNILIEQIPPGLLSFEFKKLFQQIKIPSVFSTVNPYEWLTTRNCNN